MFRLVALTTMAFAVNAQETDIFRSKSAQPPVHAAWHGFEVAGQVVDIGSGNLQLDLRNETAQRLIVSVLLEDAAGADRRETRVQPVALEAFQLKTIPVSLALSVHPFSGQIDLTYEARADSGAFIGEGQAPPLFYHPDGSVRFLAYDGLALRQRFDGGNYRGVPIPGRQENRRLFENELAIRGNRTPMAEARVDQVAVTGTQQSPAVQRRFCAWMPVSAYRDASPRTYGGQVYDYGEDYGRDGWLPMARVYLSISNGAVTLWSGYADTGGCTPYFNAPQAGGYVMGMILAGWSGGGSNLQWYVTDGDDNSNIPIYTFPNINAGGWGTVIVQMPTNTMPLVVYAPLAAGVDRYPGGNTNATFELYLRAGDDNNGTATDYHNGHPRIKVKRVVGCMRSKFTITHEYGHAILLPTLVPPLTAGDLDYIDGSHSLASKEWQFAAAIEGFAHFVAGRIWNDGGLNAGGVYVSGGNLDPTTNAVINLNAFDRYYETNLCGGGCEADKGVERDWAQFFWNYLTDPAIVAPPPTMNQLVSYWKLSYPWPKHQGFVADFAAGVLAVSGLAGHQQFLVKGLAAGVLH